MKTIKTIPTPTEDMDDFQLLLFFVHTQEIIVSVKK